MYISSPAVNHLADCFDPVFSFNDFPICVYACTSYNILYAPCAYIIRDVTRIHTFCRQIAYFRTLSLINNRKKSDVWSGGWFFLFSFFFSFTYRVTQHPSYTHCITHTRCGRYNIHIYYVLEL